MAISKSVKKQNINYQSNNEQTNMESIVTKQSDDKQYHLYDEPSTENMTFDTEHKVTSGETLSSIARKYGLTYQELADYNNITDPNYIETDQIIKIPNIEDNSEKYTVQAGDNLTKIAEKYGVSIDDLLKANDIPDPNYIEIDQIIRIPSKETESDETDELSKQIADQIKGASKKVNETVDSLVPRLVKEIQDITDKNKSTAEDVKKLVTDKLKEVGANLDEESISNIVNKVLTENKESDSNTQAQQLADQIKSASKKINDTVEEAVPVLTKQIKETNDKNAQAASALGKLIIDKLKDQKISIGSTSIKTIIDKILNINESEDAETKAQALADQVKNTAKKTNDAVDNIISSLAQQVKDIKEKSQDTVNDLKKIIGEKLKEFDVSIDSQDINNIVEAINSNNDSDTKYQQLADQIKNAAKKVNDTMEEMLPTIAKQIQNIKDFNIKSAESLKQIISDKLKEKNISVNPEKILSVVSLIMNNKANKEPTYEDYTVQSGQTLSAIAAKYGVSVDDIVKANNIADPNNINVGQVLKIPQNVATPQPTSTSTPSPSSGKINRDPVKKIDLSKIIENSNIGNAVKKYAEEIKNAFKVKIDENEFITISDVEVDGNPCFLTHIVIDDPSNIKGEPANGEYATGLEKTSSAARRKNASLMINGSNFLDSGEQDLRNTNHIAIVNGKIVHDGTSEAMEICLDKDGRLFTPSPGTTATDLINKGVVYTFASLDSRLVWNGEKDYVSQPAPENDTPYNSTVIGMTQPGEYYILTGSTTNVGAREYMYDLGCTYAKSMDQGGSVSLVFEGDLVNTPTDADGERDVGDFLYFT